MCPLPAPSRRPPPRKPAPPSGTAWATGYGPLTVLGRSRSSRWFRGIAGHVRTLDGSRDRCRLYPRRGPTPAQCRDRRPCPPLAPAAAFGRAGCRPPPPDPSGPTRGCGVLGKAKSYPQAVDGRRSRPARPTRPCDGADGDSPAPARGRGGRCPGRAVVACGAYTVAIAGTRVQWRTPTRRPRASRRR